MTQDEQILQALADAQENPADEGALFSFYERLVRAIVAKKALLTLKREQLFQGGEATSLARAGEPHLTFDALELEADTFYPWLLEIAQLFEANDPGALDEVEAIDAAESLSLACQWFEAGESDSGPTVDAMLANALAPYLERAATLLLPVLPLHIWEANYCPVCAGLPDFALWDESPRTTLICERCRATWEAPVVGCLFCGETEPDARGVYSSEDEVYLVEVCDTCGHYLKGMNLDAVEEDSEPLLAAERLLTPGLDLLALQEGYSRPTGTGLG